MPTFRRVDTAVTSPEDGGAVEQDDEDEEVDAHQVDDLHQLLERIDLFGLEHHELAGILRDAVDCGTGQTESVSQLDEHLAQIDDERSARGRQRTDVVTVGEDDERGVGCSVDALPQCPEPIAGEQLVDETDGVGLQRCRQRSGKLRGLTGKQRFEFARDVDTGEQLGGEVDRQRPTDVVVGQHLVGGRHPLIGVERLSADPAVERRGHADDRGQHDQQPDGPTGTDAAAGLLGRDVHLGRDGLGR